MSHSLFQALKFIGSRVALASCAVFSLFNSTSANAQTGPAPDFAYHWNIFTSPYDLKFGSKVDWASRIEFQGAPIQKDFVTLYEHEFVVDARSQGIALMYTNSNYWSTVRDRLRTIIEREATTTPGVRYICLDIEFLDTRWGNRTGGPSIYAKSDHGPAQFDAWFTYMRNNRPNELQGLSTADQEAVLARTYQTAVREFFLGCLREARAIRNDVKWGFYGYPNRRYGEYLQPAPNKWTQINDDLSWMFEAVDALYPALYNQILAVPDGKPNRVPGYEWEITFLSNIIRANINEFKRCARGKPVICYAGTRYHCPIDPNFAFNFLQPLDLHVALTVPREAGVNGLIIWDMIENQSNYEAHQQYMAASVNPLVRNACSVALPTADQSLPVTGDLKTTTEVRTASSTTAVAPVKETTASTPATSTKVTASSNTSTAATSTSTTVSSPRTSTAPVVVQTTTKPTVTTTTLQTKAVVATSGAAKTIVSATQKAPAAVAQALSRITSKSVAVKKPATNTKVANVSGNN